MAHKSGAREGHARRQHGLIETRDRKRLPMPESTDNRRLHHTSQHPGLLLDGQCENVNVLEKVRVVCATNGV